MTGTRFELNADRAKWMRKRAELRRMALRAKDVSPAWDALLTWFSEQNMEQFLTRGARYNSDWPPLAARTVDEKLRKGFPLDPLIRTGRLAVSLTSRPLGHERITAHEVSGGTDVEYAIFHQRGTSRMPQRRLFDARVIRREQAATTAVANWILRGRAQVGGRARVRGAR